MKVLVTLSVLQTLALFVLIVRPDGIEPQSQSHSSSVAVTSPASSASGDDQRALPASCDEACLRRILREELAQQPGDARISASPQIAPRRDEAKDRARREAVTQQIENYRSIGSMTQQQMRQLEAEIAQLDPASGAQAMRSLVRAINRDEIKL